MVAECNSETHSGQVDVAVRQFLTPVRPVRHTATGKRSRTTIDGGLTLCPSGAGVQFSAPDASRYRPFGLGVPPQIHQFHGPLDDIRIYDRALSTNEVQQLYVYESGPRVDLIKSVKPSFSNLTLTTNYQLQVLTDMSTWANRGSIFTATISSMVYPQYFDVPNWNQLFFRLQAAP